MKIARIDADDERARNVEAELLADVLALQPALVARWRQDGTVVLANDAYAVSLGRSAVDLVGRNWVEEAARMGHESLEDLDELRRLLVDQSADGAVTRVTRLWDDGPERWIQWTNRRIPDCGDGEIVLQSFGLEVTELSTAHAALYSLAHELAVRRQEERSNLARRLHDDVVQPLVAVSWALSPGEGATTLPAALAENASETVRRAVEQLRGCLVELTAPVREVASMSASIAAECAAVEAAGVRLAVRVDDVPNEEVRGVVSRVVNEALRNVVRHARATAATVTVEVCDDVVVGIVADDGVGANEHDLIVAMTSGHVGLLTSRAMVEALGGAFSVQRLTMTAGMMVRFSLPIPPRSRQAPSSAIPG